MVKHIQTIRRQLACMFDHFEGLTPKGLTLNILSFQATVYETIEIKHEQDSYFLLNIILTLLTLS